MRKNHLLSLLVHLSVVQAVMVVMVMASANKGLPAVVTLKNWTASTVIVVIPSNPNGNPEELQPKEWIVYNTGNIESSMFTLANRGDGFVITITLFAGQILALIDNAKDLVDGILVDSQGHRISTLFENLWRWLQCKVAPTAYVICIYSCKKWMQLSIKLLLVSKKTNLVFGWFHNRCTLLRISILYRNAQSTHTLAHYAYKEKLSRACLCVWTGLQTEIFTFVQILN